MANSDTVGGKFNVAKQTVNATAETLLVDASGTTLQINVIPGSELAQDGQSFRVVLKGKASGGTAATALFKIYLGTSLSGTAIAAFTVSGAAIPAAGGNFSLYADLTWDAVSGKVNGTVGGHTNNTLTPSATISQGTAASASLLNFVASVTFGAALATNSVSVTEFSTNQV